MASDLQICTDLTIVRLLKGRDAEGLELLVKKYGKFIRPLQREFGPDLADLGSQSALFKAWSESATLREDQIEGQLGGWLLKVARNAIIDRLRAEGRRFHLQLDESRDLVAPERPAERVERDDAAAPISRNRLVRDFRSVIVKMPPMQRRIIWADLKHPDGRVPDALFLAESSTTANSLHANRSKARKFLRSQLMALGYGPANARRPIYV